MPARLGDHVAGLQTRDRSRASGLDLRYDHPSAGRSLDAEFLERIGVGVAEREPG